MDDMDDVEHMRRAMAQAATVRSTTAPNPWVGCVIVPPDSAADGGAVFAGATAPPGGPHAEVAALEQAGEAARGATLYVTLEPCPMCAGALVAARVGKLVFGAADPKAGACGSLYNLCADPRLNHELPVTPGVLAAECGALLSEFFAALRKAASLHSES